MGLVVNLDDFSELCGVTAETMRSYVRQVEGSPAWLIERGSRGRDYKIDAEGGVAWWKSLRDAEEAASAEHQAQLQQLRLELIGPASGEVEDLALSGRQRREEYAATLERIKLRRLMGELVEVAPLEHALSAAVIALRTQLGNVPAEFAVKVGLDPVDVVALGAVIERALDRFAGEVDKAMEAGGGA